MAAKAGPVQLAALVEAPWIGCFHAEPERAWRLGSWDRFAIPKPFTTVRFGWAAHASTDLAALNRGLTSAVGLATSAEPPKP